MEWSIAGLYGHGVVLKLLVVATCGSLPAPTSVADDGDGDDDDVAAAGADFRANDEPERVQKRNVSENVSLVISISG